jgi:hypothetical protein
MKTDEDSVGEGCNNRGREVACEEEENDSGKSISRDSGVRGSVHCTEKEVLGIGIRAAGFAAFRSSESSMECVNAKEFPGVDERNRGSGWGSELRRVRRSGTGVGQGGGKRLLTLAM